MREIYINENDYFDILIMIIVCFKKINEKSTNLLVKAAMNKNNAI